MEAKGVTMLSIQDGKPVDKTRLMPWDYDPLFKRATTGASASGAKVRMFTGQTATYGGE